MFPHMAKTAQPPVMDPALASPAYIRHLGDEIAREGEMSTESLGKRHLCMFACSLDAEAACYGHWTRSGLRTGLKPRKGSRSRMSSSLKLEPSNGGRRVID